MSISSGTQQRSPEKATSQGLQGKVVVVTGAASGMGRATAHLLREEGAFVILGDVNEDAVLTLEKELNDPAQVPLVGGAKAFHLDCFSKEATYKFVKDVLSFKDVDVLVNNAGMPGFCKLTEEDDDKFERVWEQQMQVNLVSLARLIRGFFPSLKRAGSGVVVNISSTEGMGATLFNSPYSAAKHGVIGLTRAAAIELGPQGVRVNCVQPGPIRTNITKAIPEDKKDKFAKSLVPLRRYGYPEEVAKVIMLACRSDLTFLNGACIAVDGGLLANNAVLPSRDWWSSAL